MNGFLVDTCVISELAKKSPSPDVIRWFETTPEDLFLSAITVEEFMTGLRILGSKKKLDFFMRLMREEYEILPVTMKTAETSSLLRSAARSKGITLSMADALIASAALEGDLVLVTRNVKDFRTCNAKILNPFKTTPPSPSY